MRPQGYTAVGLIRLMHEVGRGVLAYDAECDVLRLATGRAAVVLLPVVDPAAASDKCGLMRRRGESRPRREADGYCSGWQAAEQR